MSYNIYGKMAFSHLYLNELYCESKIQICDLDTLPTPELYCVIIKGKDTNCFANKQAVAFDL